MPTSPSTVEQMFERSESRRPVPATCPCEERHADRCCAGCGFTNPIGHPRAEHRGFVHVLDAEASWDLCTLCVGTVIVRAAEWATYAVTLLLDVPAANLVV